MRLEHPCTLASVREAVARTSGELGCRNELHVLLNDNTDHSADLLAGIVDITIWHTSGGLVEAQRMLVERYGRACPSLEDLIESSCVGARRCIPCSNPRFVRSLFRSLWEG